MEAKKNVIVCPYCGWEYETEEIFVKGELEGHPTSIIKDPLGKILYTDGSQPEYIEHYICDNCEKEFIVEAQVSFKTKAPEDEVNFTEEYVSLLAD